MTHVKHGARYLLLTVVAVILFIPDSVGDLGIVTTDKRYCGREFLIHQYLA